MRGKQHTYALVDERAPTGTSLRGDDALVALALRFVESHGPAQARDFAWWAGLTVKDAQRGIDANAGTLERSEVEGRAYWSAPSNKRLPAIGEPSALLLPNYDEYLIAYRDHGASFGSSTTPPVRGELYDVLSLHIAVLDG